MIQSNIKSFAQICKIKLDGMVKTHKNWSVISLQFSIFKTWQASYIYMFLYPLNSNVHSSLYEI
jgi:hypothetical protein